MDRCMELRVRHLIYGLGRTRRVGNACVTHGRGRHLLLFTRQSRTACTAHNNIGCFGRWHVRIPGEPIASNALAVSDAEVSGRKRWCCGEGEYIHVLCKKNSAWTKAHCNAKQSCANISKESTGTTASLSASQRNVDKHCRVGYPLHTHKSRAELGPFIHRSYNQLHATGQSH